MRHPYNLPLFLLYIIYIPISVLCLFIIVVCITVLKPFLFAILLSLSSRYYNSIVATQTASLGLVGLLLSVLPLYLFILICTLSTFFICSLFFSLFLSFSLSLCQHYLCLPSVLAESLPPTAIFPVSQPPLFKPSSRAQAL